MKESAKKYDCLVDNVARRSDGIKLRALSYVENNYPNPKEKLMHGVHAIEVLSERLALSEHGLRKNWAFLKYKDTSKEMGIWF